MSTDLIAFLTARLGEYAASATAAQLRFPGPWDRAVAPDSPLPSAVSLYDNLDESFGVIRGSYAADHIVLHDPARTLREVAAGRHILDLFMSTAALVEHPSVMGEGHPYAGKISAQDYFDARRELAVLRPVVVALAAIYSDHPDYRQEWKP